jgi:hypothetical protein
LMRKHAGLLSLMRSDVLRMKLLVSIMDTTTIATMGTTDITQRVQRVPVSMPLSRKRLLRKKMKRKEKKRALEAKKTKTIDQ